MESNTRESRPPLIDVEKVPDALWQELLRLERSGDSAGEAEVPERQNNKGNSTKGTGASPVKPTLSAATDEHSGGGGAAAPTTTPRKRRLPQSLAYAAGGGGQHFRRVPAVSGGAVGGSVGVPAFSGGVLAGGVASPPTLPDLVFPGEVVVATTPEEVDAAVLRLVCWP
jgi:hypothetical protein